jgi:hypothetical protein
MQRQHEACPLKANESDDEKSDEPAAPSGIRLTYGTAKTDSECRQRLIAVAIRSLFWVFFGARKKYENLVK